MPGCGPDSDCDKVLGSRWAYIGGLPVSLFGLPVYLGAIVLLFQKSLRWKAVLPLALVILAAALWFVGLQAFALRAFCKFCMAAHVAGACAGLVLLNNNPLPFGPTFSSVGIGAASLALLILAQIRSTPPEPVQVGFGVVATNREPAPVAVVTNLVAANAVASQAPPTTAVASIVAEPTFSFVDRQLTVNLTKVPVSGRLDAPKKMVKLFDYTCHHCRDLHHLLKPIKQRYSNELAVISLPMPLDANCNAVIKRTAPAHVNACEYAKMALAVFFAKPGKFEEFSDYLFEPEHPPTLEASRAYAETLVGKEEFSSALNDPRVEQQIKLDTGIYVASSQKAKRGAMPQLLFAEGGSIGAVQSAEALERILSRALGLGEPSGTTNASETKDSPVTK